MTSAPVSVQPAEQRAARWLAALLTPLVVLLAAVGLDAVDQVTPEPLGGTAARYIPPDGQRTVLRDSAGAIVVVEHARSVGIEGLLAAPPAVAAAVLTRLGEAEARVAQWWRVTRTDDAGVRSTDLYRLSEEGIGQVAAWGGQVGFVFEPELPLLPAEAVPGDVWRESGSALADGALTFEVESAAFAATGPFTDVQGAAVPLTGGCLGVDSTVRIASPADALETVIVDSTVWCPGRGPVWSSGTVDGEPIGQAEERPLVVAALERGLPAVTPWPAAVGPSAGLDPAQRLPLVQVDPFFGEIDATAQLAVAPVALPDGRLLVANDRGDEVQWWRLGEERAELDAAAHPGGVVIALAGVGDLAVVATAQRAVVAYDGLGRRLWQWRGPELILADPVAVARAGAVPDVLVADRGGRVTLLEGGTGVPRWSVDLGGDTRAPLVVAGTTAVVGDERGRVSGLDLADGAVRWQVDAGFVDGAATDPDGATIALQLESGDLVVLDAADGSERYTARYPGIARSLVVTRDAVLALSDERLLAVALADGAELWRGPGGLALVGGGDAVAVLTADALRLTAVADGRVLDELPLEPAAVSATRGAVAVGGAVLVVDSDGVLLRSVVR